MQVVSITNDKGGVGKSTLTMLMGEWLARNGVRTLLIDLDPQANLSRRFVEMEAVPGSKDVWRPPQHPEYPSLREDDTTWDGRSSSSEIWLRGSFYEYPTRIDRLSILPAASGSLGDIEHRPKGELFGQVIQHFANTLRDPSSGLDEDFDVVVIDTRPSKGPLTSAALYASDWVIIPAQMQAPSVEGLIGVLNLRNDINLSRPADRQLKIAGIVPNLLKHNSLHARHLEIMRGNPILGPLVLEHGLMDRVAFARSMEVGGQSVYDLPSSDKARVEAETLIRDLAKKILGRDIG
jgi:chromosome partitioning protein